MKTFLFILTFSIASFFSFAVPIGFQETTIPGLIGWWTLNEGTGVNAFDYSGFSNTGALMGSPVWTNGVLGGALLFSATKEVRIPDASSLTVSNFSLVAWVYPASPSSGFQIIIVKGTHESYEMGLYNTTNALYMGAKIAGTWHGTPGGPAAGMAANSWTFVVGTFDGATCRIYTNGVEVLAYRTSAAGTLSSSSSPIDVGIGANNVNQFLGRIDDFRLYNRALTDTEIKSLYNGGAGSQH